VQHHNHAHASAKRDACAGPNEYTRTDEHARTDQYTDADEYARAAHANANEYARAAHADADSDAVSVVDALLARPGAREPSREY